MSIPGQQGILFSKVSQDQGVDTPHPQSHQVGAIAQGLKTFTCKWDRSSPFPFYGQKLVAWRCLSSQRAEKALLPCAQVMDTWNTIWQAAIMTTKVYFLDTQFLAHSLSCKQNIFMCRHHHQREKNQTLCPGPILVSKCMVCGWRGMVCGWRGIACAAGSDTL